MSGSLDVVGTGIRAGAQTTPEALSCIKGADKLFFLCADAVTEHWLKRENSTAESLGSLYAEGRDRQSTYEAMVARVLEPVLAGKAVCFASYGHPGVYAYPTHESVRRVKAAGCRARMIPGISAEDCLYADLGIDPSTSGVQSFEATDFLVHRRKHDPCSLLLLWQIGIVGEWGYKTQREPWNRSALQILAETLCSEYGERHEAIVYEASPYIMFEARIARVALEQLPTARISPLSTLCVPPLRRAQADVEMLRRLGYPLSP